MKKSIIIISLLLLLICCCSCSNIHYVSPEQSEKNFDIYEKRISSVAKKIWIYC